MDHPFTNRCRACAAQEIASERMISLFENDLVAMFTNCTSLEVNELNFLFHTWIRSNVAQFHHHLDLYKRQPSQLHMPEMFSTIIGFQPVPSQLCEFRCTISRTGMLSYNDRIISFVDQHFFGRFSENRSKLNNSRW